LEEAKEDYTQALSLDEHNGPAQVGLASILLLSEEHDEALVSLEEIEKGGFRSPALKGWLGELYLSVGRAKEAQELLSEATDDSPNDFRAVLAGALADLSMGDVDGVREFVGTLRARCPGFFFDVSKEAGLGAWGREWERTPEALRQFLDKGIHMLRGDRADKVITYFVSGGTMRVAPWTSIPAGTTGLPS